MRGWGGDHDDRGSKGRGRAGAYERDDYRAPKGNGKDWKDAFAIGYAAAMKAERNGGGDYWSGGGRRGRSRSPARGGRKGKGKGLSGEDDPYRNFGSSRFGGGDRKGDRGGKGKGRQGKGRSDRESEPIDSAVLDNDLDAYFGNAPSHKIGGSKQEGKKDRKGKGGGKEEPSADKLDSQMDAYFGRETKKEEAEEKKDAEAADKTAEKDEKKTEEKPAEEKK